MPRAESTGKRSFVIRFDRPGGQERDGENRRARQVPAGKPRLRASATRGEPPGDHQGRGGAPSGGRKSEIRCDVALTPAPPRPPRPQKHSRALCSQCKPKAQPINGARGPCMRRRVALPERRVSNPLLPSIVFRTSRLDSPRVAQRELRHSTRKQHRGNSDRMTAVANWVAHFLVTPSSRGEGERDYPRARARARAPHLCALALSPPSAACSRASPSSRIGTYLFRGDSVS